MLAGPDRTGQGAGGRMSGKVLVPTQEAIQKLIAARLAADVAGTPTIILARTDEGNAAVEAAVREKVVKLTDRFPMYGYLG